MGHSKYTHNKRMQSDQTTRYARGLAADAGRYCDTMSHDLLLNSNLEVVDLAMVWCHLSLNRGCAVGIISIVSPGSQALGKRCGDEWYIVRFLENVW